MLFQGVVAINIT